MNHCLLFNVSVTERFGAGRTVGAYRIAHHLRQNNWDVEVIDFAMDWTLDELKSLAMSRVTSDTKFFGFSHMFSAWSETLEQFISWCRVKYPTLKYISGSSVNPLFHSNQLDYYVQGFGEKAIIVLLEYLFSNGERPRFWLNSGKKIINAIADYPAYPMLDSSVEYQKRDFIESHEWLGMEFSRGCMFSCDFCNFPLLGVKEDTSRSSESFDLDMRRNYDSWGVKNYAAVDETFNDRPAKIKKFADVVERLPFEPFFTGFVRPDLLVTRPNDRVDMARMNFRGHYYGIESFNRPSAKTIGKGMDSEKLKSGLVEVKKYFETNGNGLYRGTIGLIVGLPYDTRETLEASRDWMIKNWSGQSYTVWPLVIPDHELEVKSKFFDHTKYGYEKMTPDEVKLFQNESPKEYDFTNPLAIDGMYWKNENMNVFTARDILFDVFYNAESFNAIKYKPLNFELAGFAFGKNDVRERLNSVSPAAACYIADEASDVKMFMYETIKYNFIQNYKRRKLSL